MLIIASDAQVLSCSKVSVAQIASTAWTAPMQRNLRLQRLRLSCNYMRWVCSASPFLATRTMPSVCSRIIGMSRSAVRHQAVKAEILPSLGDTIALQYGGSALVNRVDTYMKRSHWQSASRDKLEGIRRFYSNVALDPDKQNSINLFLGIDTGDAVLASVSTAASLADKLLPAITAAASGGSEKRGEAIFTGDLEKVDDLEQEASSARGVPRLARRDYRHWYTEENLNSTAHLGDIDQRLRQGADRFGDWWQE